MAPVPEGTELARFTLPVDASKAREMGIALHASGWRESGSDELIGRAVVPSFTTTAGLWYSRFALMKGPLGLDMDRVLHGEQRWRYERLPGVGEQLEAIVTLRRDERREGRRGGSMRVVTLHSEFAADGELVVEEEMVVLEPAVSPSRPADEQGARKPEPVSSRGCGESRPRAERDPIGGPWSFEKLSRGDFVRYAGASGDFNPIHHDEPYAVRLGLPSVFSMGMLQGGMVGVYLAERLGADRIGALSMRFRDRLWADEGLSINGWWVQAGESCEVEARAGDGRLVLTAMASIRVNRPMTGSRHS